MVLCFVFYIGSLQPFEYTKDPILKMEKKNASEHEEDEEVPDNKKAKKEEASDKNKVKDIKSAKKTSREGKKNASEHEEDEEGPDNKKAKKEGVFFKKEIVQKLIVNGTYQGLDDILVAKFENEATPAVLFACDELSVLFNALEKDPGFESIFLMLYTAKVICSSLIKLSFVTRHLFCF